MSEARRDELNIESLIHAVDAGTDRLREYLERFHGGIRPDGEIIEGIGPQWEELVAQHADEIVLPFEREGKRAPAKEIVQARAQRIAKKERPDLHRDYYALRGSIEIGQRWLSGKRAALSGLQTLNKSEHATAGAGGAITNRGGHR